MAGLNMSDAFDADMLTKLVKHSVPTGSFDANNNWIEGTSTPSDIYGVILPGNKFSQFEEGVALHNHPGGKRYSDYRSLHMRDLYTLEVDDKVAYKGKYYNVLQKSDLDEYNFYHFLLEKSKDWTP